MKCKLDQILSHLCFEIGWKLVSFSLKLRPQKQIMNQTVYYYPQNSYENIITFKGNYYFFKNGKWDTMPQELGEIK